VICVEYKVGVRRSLLQPMMAEVTQGALPPASRRRIKMSHRTLVVESPKIERVQAAIKPAVEPSLDGAMAEDGEVAQGVHGLRLLLRGGTSQL
jgi:hypothetical protein